MERCEPFCVVKLQTTRCKAETFSVFLRQEEESGAWVDHGANGVQVRRDDPTEATRIENALRLRCS